VDEGFHVIKLYVVDLWQSVLKVGKHSYGSSTHPYELSLDGLSVRAQMQSGSPLRETRAEQLKDLEVQITLFLTKAFA